jgi:hypothetical protein
VFSGIVEGKTMKALEEKKKLLILIWAYFIFGVSFLYFACYVGERL